MNNEITVVIAGAGIGGLTAAFALAKKGMRVTLLERAPMFEEVGAGLQISPNASRILRDLGALDRLGDNAFAPDALRIRRARDGQELVRMPLGPVADARWGAPHIVVHRADLQLALVEAVAAMPSIRVECGVEVAGFAVTSDGVQVGARRNGEPVRYDGDVLIGADGLRSAVRARMGFDATDAPVWSGRTAWRALVPAASAPAFALRPETALWLGPRAHLVHYPLRQASLVNVVVITQDGWRDDETSDIWTHDGHAAEVTRHVARWHRDAATLVQGASAWKRWPLFDRGRTARWRDGRVALLGDAAHPMLPFLAQGASQAIEDAAVLARELATRPGDVESALAAYERERLPRATAIQIASRRQCDIYHMTGPAAFVRDAVMRRMGPGRLMQRMDWIYGGGRN